jgi:hypothetical protein
MVEGHKVLHIFFLVPALSPRIACLCSPSASGIFILTVSLVVSISRLLLEAAYGIGGC